MSYVFTSSRNASASIAFSPRQHYCYYSFEIVDFDGNAYTYDTEAESDSAARQEVEDYCSCNGIQADYIALNNVEAIV